MTIKFILKKFAARYQTDVKSTIYIRIVDGRDVDVTIPTKIEVNPNWWDQKSQCLKSKILCDENYRLQFNQELQAIKMYVEEAYSKESKKVSSDWLKIVVKNYYKPQRIRKKKQKKDDLTLAFDRYLSEHQLSVQRQKHFRVLVRILQRYDLYMRETCKKNVAFDINTITPDTLRDIWNYMENEYKYYEQYPEFFKLVPECRPPQQRSRNTLIDMFSRFRSFMRWCYDNGLTANRPFDKFQIGECIYGTPYYINIEERNQIMNHDFSSRPALAVQRDIFIFQTFVGCRVSDLYRFTRDNIVNGMIEYIPRKTKEGNPLTVRVPLNDHALDILDRYKDCQDKLLPFISEQKYNQYIKEIFKLAGINRMVTVLDPISRNEVRKPLYEVASSHMARRTFIGNIYKKVKDPNLVASMSGHKENSKAFNRYRNIDDDVKKELISFLD